MKYVFCPVCGHKLLEGAAGSQVRVKCAKCKEIVEVAITETNINLLPLSSKQSISSRE